jgi:Fe-S-cluster containining protein
MGTVAFDCQRCGACCANSAPNRREKFVDYVEVRGRDKLSKEPKLLRPLTFAPAAAAAIQGAG